MERILIVRMSALGDIVHALPVLAAIRAANDSMEVDWLVDRKYAGVLDFVEGIAQRIIGRPGLLRAVSTMRRRHYDVAVDLQGLLKSATMARLSGAARVIGFERAALREKGAALRYSEAAAVPTGAHIIQKNLSVLSLLDIANPGVRFNFKVPASPVADHVSTEVAARRATGSVLLNPGAAWPNKRWAPERFGQVARHLRDRHALASFVLWGPGEEALAEAVVSGSDRAATRAPQTGLGDLLALCARASLMVSGDTGPTHLAAALATPIVGLYGPTWPERNGPWGVDDQVVSRAGACECHHKRQCQRAGTGPIESRMCLNEISVSDVIAAVDRRLALSGGGSR